MVSKLLTAALLTLLLYPGGGLSEQLVSPSGSGHVMVFKTEDMMDYAINHIVRKQPLTDPTFLATIRAIVRSGTRCSVIQSKWTRKQVRIMEGPSAGAIGWVPTEMVQP